jgi:hypothetical protein
MITQERLKELLSYDPQTGEFTWIKAPPRKGFLLGQRAGYKTKPGYRVIKIDQKTYGEAHLAFLYMTGGRPEEEVDHKNIDPSDNSWSNLRCASKSQNQRNKGRYSNNTSGVKGVRYCEGSYLARVAGAPCSKRFKTLEEASEWVEFVREELHGEFARHI